MSTPGDDEVLFEDLGDGVAVVTMNRPAKLNAMSATMWDRLTELFRTITPDDARCLVLTGAGDSFSAGHDISEPFSSETHTMDIYYALAGVSVPVVAAVRGWVVGGAAGLCALSTLRVASPSAKFWFKRPVGAPEGSGYGPDPALLSRLLPPNIAIELIVGEGPMSAERGYQLGFYNHVVAEDDLLDRAVSLASKFTVDSPDMVRRLRASIEECAGPPHMIERLDIAARDL